MASKRFDDTTRRNVTVYSGREWTGPGKSYWYESFWEPGPYVEREARRLGIL